MPEGMFFHVKAYIFTIIAALNGPRQEKRYLFACVTYTESDSFNAYAKSHLVNCSRLIHYNLFITLFVITRF